MSFIYHIITDLKISISKVINNFNNRNSDTKANKDNIATSRKFKKGVVFLPYVFLFV